MVNGECFGVLIDTGFTYFIDSKKWLPDRGPIITKDNPTAVIARLCGVAPAAVRYVENEIESCSGEDHYKELVELNIRDGRWLTDADLSAMDRPD